MQRIPSDLRKQFVYDHLQDRYFPKQQTILDTVDPRIQFLTIAGGIGASKSWTAARYTIPDIVLADTLRQINGWPSTEQLNLWVVGADYDKPRMEWQYIIDTLQGSAYLLQLCGGIVDMSQPRNGSWVAKTGNGVSIETRTWAMSSGSDPLHAVPVHMMIVAEAGLLDEWTWENRLLPRIGRTNGYMIHAGTFEAAGPWMKELYRKGMGADDAHRAFSMASWDNIFRYPGGRHDPAIMMMEGQMSPETFLERCAAIPKRPSGLVHAAFEFDRHVQNILPDDDPIEVCVDPGANGYYVGIVQVSGSGRDRKLRVLDEFFQGEGGTTDQAIAWLLDSEWANRVTGGVIDVRTPEQALTWQRGMVWSGSPGLHLRSQSVPILAGIERVDTLLHSVVADPDEIAQLGDKLWPYHETLGLTRLLIHPRCKRLIWEMSTGYKYPKSRDGNTREAPKDENNHACKALAYYAVDRFGVSETVMQKRKLAPDMFRAIRPSPKAIAMRQQRRGPRISMPVR